MSGFDEAFPPEVENERFKGKSFDELFPVEIERDRYRRQTLGTSPIQDLIFGDTSVNPIARVLDHFGQGARQGWGAEPNGLSDESANALKKVGIFNDYDKGQRSVIKAMNESMFRGAATYLADPIVRGVPALFRGGQAAIAQTGVEASGTPVDTALKAINAAPSYLMGDPQVGQGTATLAREFGGGGFEAFPTGFRQATGVPHAPRPGLPDTIVNTIEEAPRPIVEPVAPQMGLKLVEAPEGGIYTPNQFKPGERYFKAVDADGNVTAEMLIKVDGAKARVEDILNPSAPREAGIGSIGNSQLRGLLKQFREQHPEVTELTGKRVSGARAGGEYSLLGEPTEISVRLPMTEIERARDLGVIGAGEAGWRGTGEVPAPTIKEQAAAVKPEVMESGMHQPVEVAPGEVRPTAPLATETAAEPPRAAPELPAGPMVDASHPIARDVARRLEHAGRPPEEAAASGQVIASHYESRAARFGGELGTAEEMYKAEGARIRGPNGEAPELVAPPRPKIVLPGSEAVPERPNQSLLDFLAREGGLKPTPDLQSIFGGENPTIPGAGRLFRKDGLTMDEALTRAKENSFVLDPNDIQHAPGAENGGANTVRWQDLQDMIAEEAAGNKQYRNTRSAEPAKINRDEEFRHISDELHRQVEESGGDPRDIDPVTERRVVEMIQKGETSDVLSAYERAIMETEYNQIKRGKIRFSEDGKPIITLFKDANASTFIHETGHHWLEELMKDAQHAKAPEGLRADADSVLKWLGVDSYYDIKVRHHEQFARGFERYLMEGVAPSKALVSVFEKFRNWLTSIYQSVTRLKSPVNDEIRGVFDRLLAIDPEKVKIEPAKGFADIHEADALSTLPEAAHPVAQTIRAERDRLATEQIPEEHDARLEGVASGASRREAGGPQPVRDVNETPRPEEAGNNQTSGEVGAGGSNVAPEGAGPSTVARTEVPVNPNDTFKAETPLVDKAGNIRLDNLGTAEDVNTAIRDAAAANNDFIDARRGVVTDGQVLELADALGMDAGQLNQRKLGQAFNAEQIMAARKLLIQSATTVRDTMIKAANGAEADILAYAEAKSRHRLIQEQVAGITAEAGRALRAFRKLEGQQEAVQIDAFLKDATGKTLFQLQREAQLGMQLETPAQVSKFINDTSKPTWKEMVVEAWISALLSGPKTHVANIVGNSISGMWRPIETATSAVIGKARSLVTGSQDRVHFGEAAAELFGMVHGSREGVVAAYKAFKTEEPQLTAARQVEQGHPKALPSATLNVLGKEIEIGGKQARIPLRLLGAEDEFFKAVAFRGDINRQAYAVAAKEGLPAEQFHARVAELSMTPTEDMITHAKGVAEYQTFQTPLGKVGRSVQNFANSHLLAKFIVPFVRTPLNLLKYAGERTPLGVFSQEVRDNLSGKNGAVARDTQIARITLGTMVGVAAYEMASQGLITGGGPADKGKKTIMQADGWQEYSVKIGDMYYKYNRLDPFSIILGIAADAYEINKAAGADHPEKEKLANLVFAAVTKNVLNRASLQGMSDVIQATSDPERYGKGYLKSMAGTIIPAISAQTAQTMDPVVRETRTVLDRLKSRIPGLSQDLLAKRDVWGEPVTREGGLGPDIASPIAESRLKNDPVNKALIGASYFPGKLDRKIRGVELTDQQYDDYSRIAGRTAKMRLDMIVKMPGFEQMPEGTRKELMTNAVTTSREMARSLIMMQNPDIIKKANDAKVMKLRSEKATP